MSDYIVVLFEYVIGHALSHDSAQSWFVQSAFVRNLRI